MAACSCCGLGRLSPSIPQHGECSLRTLQRVDTGSLKEEEETGWFLELWSRGIGPFRRVSLESMRKACCLSGDLGTAEMCRFKGAGLIWPAPEAGRMELSGAQLSFPPHNLTGFQPVLSFTKHHPWMRRCKLYESWQGAAFICYLVSEHPSSVRYMGDIGGSIHLSPLPLKSS